MAIEKFLTSSKLLEYVDEEIKETLKKHELLNLFDYAWLNEHDPDPDFIGLAKWGIDGLHGLFQPDSCDRFYTLEQFESLSTISQDLEALMDMSRVAIGNALWMADMFKNDIFDHRHHFWVNQINSITLLGMVSDRIRDLFLLIAFNEKFKHYKKLRESKTRAIGEHKSHHYQYPFFDAFTLPKMDSCRTQLIALQVLAKAIYEQRDARNDTVHEVATQAGALTKKWFKNKEAKTFITLNQSLSVHSAAWEEAQAAHIQTIDSSMETVTSWYLNLVHAISHVFDIEHILRTQKL